MTTTAHPILHSTDHLPWLEVAPGFALKVLHGAAADETRALLLRLEPGTVVPFHRHEGEVHAINLLGTRKLDTGEVIGPGGYVYEPAGNQDSWEAIGADPVVVFVTVRGAMETVDEEGRATERSDTASIAAAYRRFLNERGRR